MRGKNAVHAVSNIGGVEFAVFVCFRFDECDGFCKIGVVTFVVDEALCMVEDFFVCGGKPLIPVGEGVWCGVVFEDVSEGECAVWGHSFSSSSNCVSGLNGCSHAPSSGRLSRLMRGSGSLNTPSISSMSMKLIVGEFTAQVACS